MVQRTVYLNELNKWKDKDVIKVVTGIREMAPLRAISDNYPKTVLTLDRFTLGDYDGIEVINVVDWLMS